MSKKINNKSSNSMPNMNNLGGMQNMNMSQSKGSKSKKKLPKYADGAPWIKDGSLTSAGTSGVGGIADIAGGLGGLLKNEDKSSTANYAGNILGETGKYAGMGAALGPWGAAAGAVVGAGLGIVESIGQEKAQKLAEKKQEIANTTSLVANSSAATEAKYNLRNMTNNRVPGLNKGIANFNNPNAMIANQEGILDPNTGRVSTVPGTYDSSNPDVVPANLPDGASVYSKRKDQIIPGGKSTPADIIAKAEKVQKINDRIINPKKGDNRFSRLDRLTAELNQRNIQNQAEHLNKYNVLVNPPVAQSIELPKYDIGLPGDQVKNIEDPNDANVKPNLTGPINQTYEQYLEDMAQGGFQPVSRIDWKNGKASVSRVSGGLKKAPADTTDLLKSTKFTVVPVDMSSGYDASSRPTVSSELTSFDRMKLKSQAYSPMEISTLPNSDSPKEARIGNNIDMKSIGNKLMSLSAISHNARNTSPEVAQPIYESYMNPTQRYNIAPQLAESVKQRNISRYTNAALNTSTGANQAYGGDIYSRGIDQLSGLMNTAESANAGFRENYANRYNEFSGRRANEDRRIADLNARNRAAARSFGSKNAEMLSQYGQVQQQMQNQSKNDSLNAYVYSLYNTAMTKEQRAGLNDVFRGMGLNLPTTK